MLGQSLGRFVRGAVVRNTVYFAPAANVQNHWPHRSVVSEAQGPLRAGVATGPLVISLRLQ